ncbi:MAG: hypothetical protein ACO1SV_04830 [Fimbriimonas sp.]
MDAEPNLTTVPDAAGGRRTFTWLLALMCALAVAGLMLVLVRTFTRERPAESIARSRFDWDHRFAVIRANDGANRADAWFRTTKTLKPAPAVQALYDMNYYRVSTAPYPVKSKKPPKPQTRLVAVGSVGEEIGVEYDAKRGEYHMWWQRTP